MFQRKQNYILLIMLLVVVVFIAANLPIYTGQIAASDKIGKVSINFYMCEIGDIKMMNTYLFIACNLLALFIVSTLRSFKNLQQQLMGVKVIFVAILAVTFLIYFPQGKIMEEFQKGAEMKISVVSFVFLIMFVLNLLVYRGVKKDIELLASADRLR
ncbi:MAG: DUF4293 family protein [Bacteroidia bacterium]|nr:DUF4293 family protein [Bacteroidia bacterium]